MSKKEKVSTSTLTDAERLLIARRREDRTQAEEAKHHKVPRSRYVKMENGQIPISIPVPPLGKMEAHERCLIYRRRSSMSQDEVAQKVECCRYLINQMERGEHPCDNLIWFWEN